MVEVDIKAGGWKARGKGAGVGYRGVEDSRVGAGLAPQIDQRGSRKPMRSTHRTYQGARGYRHADQRAGTSGHRGHRRVKEKPMNDRTSLQES